MAVPDTAIHAFLSAEFQMNACGCAGQSPRLSGLRLGPLLHASPVMPVPGLDPGIGHGHPRNRRNAWGSKYVDRRDTPGHDAKSDGSTDRVPVVSATRSRVAVSINRDPLYGGGGTVALKLGRADSSANQRPRFFRSAINGPPSGSPAA